MAQISVVNEHTGKIGPRCASLGAETWCYYAVADFRDAD